MRLTEDEIVASLPPWYTQVSPAQMVDTLQLPQSCEPHAAAQWRELPESSAEPCAAPAACATCGPVLKLGGPDGSCCPCPQITSRAIVTGLVLGVLYGFITMRFALGPFGVVPTFNMPMGAAPTLC